MRSAKGPARVFLFCVLGLFALVANAQTSKPNLSGKWQLNSDKSELHAGKTSPLNLTVEQNGSAIHVVRTAKTSDGKEAVTEFKCTTDGKDCAANKGAKVSLWYDDQVLVELDVSDESVTKSNMTLAADGKSISVTITYISPQGASETLVFEKI